ncbi:AAA family ATPase [Tranquillimonas alkanivorans]|uniref:RecA-family ATPase n=1 Tax=Tranquillimonas alkanivorans TaxID=441119 RepID=A0A1I5L1C5_9RHOB|nr:AAA family ATPase [Tranquillimonas alkanivorans]SFO90983.1 RecA-family ATPase [Tranquillimonas alkanivorans]
MKIDQTMPTILSAALECAERGWHVFPAPLGTKKSHKSAQHSEGRAWGATIDPAEIERDWQQWPAANLGIVTGPKSGFFVIDADTEDGHGVDGVGTLRQWVEEHGPLPDTIEAHTPSGGWHIYFRYPEGAKVQNSEGRIAPGIDVRGDGGMVLGTPSVKPGTGFYRWKNPPGFFDLGECPEWLLEKVLAAQKPKLSERASVRIDTGGNTWGDAALRDELAGLLSAPEGRRNGALNHAAFKLGQIVGGGQLDETLVRDRLAAAAQGVGLEPGEIGPTIQSGLTAGMAEPRRPQEREQAHPPSPPLSAYANEAPQPQSPPEPERTSRFYSASTLKGKRVPEREWLVPDWVPSKTVTLFSGDGGTGKSLLALQMAVAVASGGGWLGLPVKAGRVIYMSAEDDDDELHRRTDDILRANCRDYEDVEGLTLRSLAGEDALLAVETQLALMQSALFKELEQRTADEQPALVVIDTLADVYPANENDRAKVRQFIGILRGLALRQKCAVILLGHPSLTGLNSGSGTSGSTAWNNSVRSRMYLHRIVEDGYEPDPNKRILSSRKNNYGPTGTEIGMTWDAGVFKADSKPTGLDRMSANARAERIFLKLLSTFTAQGRRVNAKGGTNYAPKVFAAHPNSEGMTKRALSAAMESLLTSGKLVVMTEGPQSRRVSYIAEADK